MKDLFNEAYEALIVFIDNLETSYEGIDVNKAIMDFVTHEDSKYDKMFTTYYECVFSLSSIKLCLMRTFVSRSYMLNYYDFKKGINEEYAEGMLEELDNLDADQVYQGFFSHEELYEDILDDFLEFIDRPFIFQNKAMEMVYKEKKDVVLDLNLLEIFDLPFFVPSDKYSRSELVIQDFFDLYNKAAAVSQGDEESFVANFSQELESYLSNDEEKSFEFISYLLANVYEALAIEYHQKDSSLKEYFNLVPIFEKNSLDTLVAMFYEEEEFALTIIDLFIMINSSLNEYELYDKRNAFKDTGDELILKRLNPYYEEEEVIYEKWKSENQ